MWIAIVALLTINTSHGDQRTKAVKIIDQANEKLEELSQPQCDTCSVAQTGKDDPAWKQCLTALCPAGFGQYYEGIKKAAVLELEASEERQLNEQVKKSFRTEIESKLGSYQRLQSFIKSGRALSDPRAVQLGNLGLTIERFDKLVFNEAKIDKTASREKLKNLSDEEFETTIAVVSPLIDQMANPPTLLLNEDYDFYVQRYSKTVIQEHVNDALDKLTKVLPAFEAGWGFPANSIFDTMKLGSIKRLRSGKFGRKEIEDLQQDLNSANFFVKINSDPQMVARLRSHKVNPATVLGEDAQATLTTRIEYMKAFLENREVDQLGLAFNFNSILETCKNNLRLAKQFNPKPSELSSFKKRLDKYSKDFAASMESHMSAASKATFSKELANWKLSLPASYEDYRADLFRRLQDDHTSTVSAVALAKRLNATKPQLVTAVDVFTNAKFKDDPEYGKNLKELCEENAPQPLRDKASIGADRVTLGSLSVRDEHYGNGTAKHEFGHLTSGLFLTGKMSSHSKDWYDRVRACLQKPKGHERNVEEDWADLVSAGSGGKYDNCTYTENLESEMTLKDNPNDTHSSHLYRHLHNLIVSTGSIPEVCQRVLAEKGEKFTLNNCSNPPAVTAQ